MFNNIALVNESNNLRKFAMRLTKNASDADDLLQSTLLRALEKRDMFETGTNLFKWTSKIMFNIFVSNYRRKARFETQYDPESILENQTVSPCQEHVTDLNTARKAMAQLSEDHREILVLVCVKGMQYEEAADVLNIPVGTVRSRLSRAREQLQLLLMPAQPANDYSLGQEKIQAVKYAA